MSVCAVLLSASVGAAPGLSNHGFPPWLVHHQVYWPQAGAGEPGSHGARDDLHHRDSPI